MIANQVASEYQTKEAILIKYLNKVHNLAKNFKFFQILYVPREHIAQEDLLLKLDIIKKPSYNMIVVQETLYTPNT